MESDEETSSEILFINRNIKQSKSLYSFRNYNIVPLRAIIPGLEANFFEGNSMPLVIIILANILSATMSSLAILPFTVFPGFLPTIQRDFICILRSAAYFIVFYYVWIEAFRSLYRFLFVDSQNTLCYYETRVKYKILCCIFGACYGGIYCWKWTILENLPIKIISLIAFFVSFSAVFTKLLFHQLTTSLPSSTAKNNREIILKSASAVEKEIAWNAKATNSIAEILVQNTISPFSCLLPLRNDYYLHEVDENTLLSLYQDDFCDTTKYSVTACANILLGVSWIALWLTMIEDYGYAIFSTTGLEEEKYLWLIAILCGLLSASYVLCSYNLYHRSVASLYNFLRLNGSLDILKTFVISIPYYFLGGCIASTRLAASYTIFGRIAAKFVLPYSIGFTLIYSGMIIVFSLDMVTSSRLIFISVKSLFTLVLSWFYPSFPNRLTSWFYVRYYCKKLKQRVRNLNSDGISVCIGETLCRKSSI